MNYQLVLQWSCGSTSADLEMLVETEDLLIRLLPAGNKVEGHDIGSGEGNIFILTNDPVSSFQQVRAVLESRVTGKQFARPIARHPVKNGQ